MAARTAGIVGTGAALPEKIITNADLEKMVDTTDQWITERTGIKQRHQAAPHETTSSLSVQAACRALEMSGHKPKDIDMIICSTIFSGYAAAGDLRLRTASIGSSALSGL